MKAIILARVSTKEQEEGHSIAAQRQRLVDYCARKGLQVIKIFELIKSSTRGERKAFAAMLEFVQAQKELIAIVADAVDRFQRSFKESVIIDNLIRKKQVELHFYRENMVIGEGASSSDILRWDFAVLGAKSYVANLSDNVRRSLEYKRKKGEWGGKAPLGYLNQRDANNKSTVVPDPERAFLVRLLFEEYAKGCSSISGDLVHRAREWGLRNKTLKGGQLSASQIRTHSFESVLLRGDAGKGKTVRTQHAPLISKGLFDKCEEVRRGNSRATTTRYSEKPFLFRGLVKCATSQRTVTCDLKKGRHIYLICRDPAGPEKKLFVPEDVVLDQIMAVFRAIQVPPKVLNALLAHMKAGHEAENRFHRDAIEGLRRQYDLVRERLKRLLDLRIDGSITQDEYDTKARELKQRQTEIGLRIEQHQKGDGDFRTTLESLISLASRAAELFERSKTEQKREPSLLCFRTSGSGGKS